MKKALTALKYSAKLFLEKDERETDMRANTVDIKMDSYTTIQIVDANGMAILNCHGASCQMIDSSGECLMYENAKEHVIKSVSKKRTDDKNSIIEIIIDETSGVYYAKTTKELYEDTGYASMYPLR